MSACAGSLTRASRPFWSRRRYQVRPLFALGQSWTARALFSSISPARSGWIAPGRIGFMSTQRRDNRNTPATDICRRDSRCRRGFGRRIGVGSSELSSAPEAPFVLARTPGLTATVHFATNSLQSDSRNTQLVRLVPRDNCRGSWPPGVTPRAVPPRLRRTGFPPLLFPSCLVRLHLSLPRVPVAIGRRTERYDGKRDLHLQHAA
jgi:hypothetical protein